MPLASMGWKIDTECTEVPDTEGVSHGGECACISVGLLTLQKHITRSRIFFAQLLSLRYPNSQMRMPMDLPGSLHCIIRMRRDLPTEWQPERLLPLVPQSMRVSSRALIRCIIQSHEEVTRYRPLMNPPTFVYGCRVNFQTTSAVMVRLIFIPIRH